MGRARPVSTPVSSTFLELSRSLLESSPRRSPSSPTLVSTETTLWTNQTRLLGTRAGPPTLPPRRRSRGSPLSTLSTTSSSPQCVTLSSLSVFPFPTFTTSRVLDRSSAVLLSREPSCLVMSLELFLLALRTRRFSPLNSTRSNSRRLAQETPLVSPSRVLPRTRRCSQEISSTSRRMVTSSPSRPSLPWLPCRSTLVFSSLDMPLLSSAVPLRLHAR